MIQTLGRVGVRSDGEFLPVGRERRRDLLALLASEPEVGVSTDRLLDLLWRGDDSDAAASALRMSVARLRSVLGPAGSDAIMWTNGVYRLTVEASAIDHLVFGREVALGDRAADAGRLDEAAARYRSALELWQGESAFGDSGLTELEPLRERLRRQRIHTVGSLCDVLLASGESRSAAELLVPWHLAEPTDERLAAQLMRSLYEVGRQREALEVAARTRSELLEQAGLSPGPELSELESGILTHSPTLLGPGRRARTLPPSLAMAADTPIFGRDDELAVIGDGLLRAGRSGSHFVVYGPAGIGKTRLLAAVGEIAIEGGFHLAHVAVNPLSADPLGPIVEVAEQLGDAGVAEGPGPGDAAVALDGVASRLARAITGASSNAAGTLLVLDDAHTASSATLAVVARVMRVAPPRLVTLISGRTHAAGAGWSAFLGELSMVGARVIELDGLGIDDLRQFPEYAGLSDAQATEVRALTGGNPFHVGAVIAGFGSAVPTEAVTAVRRSPTVAAALERRLGGVDGEVRLVLSIAALGGLTVDTGLLTEVAGDQVPVASAIRRAIAARLVRTHADLLQLDHELLRVALIDLLDPSEARRWHLALARAEQARHADPLVIATHLAAVGGPDTARERAGCWRQAGDQARDQAAHDLALDHYEAARTAIDAAREAGLDVPQDLELALRLGIADATRGVGRHAEARAAIADLIDEVQDRPDALLEVFLVLARWSRSVTTSDPALRLIHSLVDRIDLRGLDFEAAMQAVIVCAAAEGATDDLRRLHEHHVGAARSDRDVALAERARLLLLDGSTVSSVQRRAVDRQIRSAERADDVDLLVSGLASSISFALQTGEIERAEREAERYLATIEDAPHPHRQWIGHVMQADMAQHAGRLEEAARHAEDGLVHGLDHGIPDAEGSFGGHMLVTSWLTGGDMSGFAEPAAGLAERYAHVAVFSAAEALSIARSDPATAIPLICAATERLEREPPSVVRGIAIASVGQALLDTAAVDEAATALASRVLHLAEPLRGTAPRMAHLGTSLGPIDRIIGGLLVVLGDVDGATTALCAAVEWSRAARTPPWLAWSLAEASRLTGDEAARTEARRLAAVHGLRPLLTEPAGGR